MKPRALVSGATGFVGRGVASHLVTRGWEVHALCRPASHERVPAGATSWVLRSEGENLPEILAGARPEVVLHLASQVLVDHRPEQAPELVRSNLEFGVRLVEAMLAVGCTRLVDTGTSWQHYQDAEYRPVNLYAATKQAFQDLLRYYTEATALRAWTLELGDTYGPGDSRRKILPLLLRVCREGTPLDLRPGRQRLDLVHVADVARAYELAARALLAPETESAPPPNPPSRWRRYAVRSGRSHSLREIVALLEVLRGAPLPVTWGGRSYREREVFEPWSHGEVLPGWEPERELEEELASLLRELPEEAPVPR